MASPDTWKILFIDDEADIREMVTLALEDSGYRVVTAADGRSGVHMCREASPQIVITDIRMPKMNGIQVLEAVKQMDPDIEVIVITAFGEMDLAVRALQLDASDFITKPINDASLHLALGRAKERYTARRELKDYTALLEREKARTSQELIRTFRFQKMLIESSMDGILVWDETGTVVTFNPAMERMTGVRSAEVVGRRSWQRFFEPGQADRFLDLLGAGGHGGVNRLALHETHLIGADDRKIPVQVSAVRLLEHNAEAGVFCFFRDLRQIRALEREMADQARILHQDKMMSLGRLASSVVHEINNPLSGVLNYIRLMARILQRGPLPEARRENFIQYLDLVETEIDRCAHIVSSLLAFSRKSPPAFGPVNLEELLERCIAISRHKMGLENIALKTRIDADLPTVNGDFNQIQQCVINLVFNAIDAMPDGGTLTIGCCFKADAGAVQVSVTDTGHGIAPEELPRIFEPFYTTKKEGYGVGLGLSTLYGIVERHKGTIGVETRVGQGTTFTIHLPAGGAADPSSGPGPLPREP